MSSLAIPTPPDDGHNARSGDASPRGQSKKGPGRGQRSAAPPVPSEAECLQRLAHLPSLVALRVLTPAQANSMAAPYREILRHHQRVGTGQAARAVPELDVLAIAARDPDLINFLAPLLSDEQVAVLLARNAEGAHD